MSYLICIDEVKRQVLHPEIVKLVDSFKALSFEEMLYVALFTDYNSIYKQFPENERKRKAMWHAFNDNEHETVIASYILSAIDDYTSLQYNAKIETARIFQKKIDRYQEQLLVDESPSSSKKIGDAIDDLTKRISALYKDYDKEVEKMGVIKGKMELSYLEKVMSNMKHYKSITEKSKK